MRLKRNNFFILIMISLSNIVFADENIYISQFSLGKIDNWESQTFKDSTDYQIVTLDSTTTLRATSNNSASGLVKKIRIDLFETPYINWQWQVSQSLYRLAEDFKEGDDFVARIYIIVDGGIFFWRTLALNYVWSSSKPVGSLWDNPFTENAQMMAIESGDAKANQWVSEKRNVREDLQKAFGRDFRFIDAVAIMTDTDNSGQRATAYYGDIYFSAK